MNTTLSNYCRFKVNNEISYNKSFKLVIFFQDCLYILALNFHVIVIISSCVPKAFWDFYWAILILKRLIGKDSDAGRDWGQEEKGTTEDDMAGWHH